MAVVIRLQGLSISAGSQDIRKFFAGLRIPDGGVHIVGGELEEAFIIFGSDEDARIAMTKSGDYIRGSPVRLLLSSKAEMQNILERSAVNLLVDQRKNPKDKLRHLDMGELRGSRGSTGEGMSGTSSNRMGHSPMENRMASSFGSNEDNVLLLRGMPFAVTEKDVRKFFAGLVVNEVVLLQNHRGQNNGNGVVTFATKEDVRNGLKRHKEYIGTRFVEVYTTKEWQRVFGALPAGVTVSSMPEMQERSPQRGQQMSQYRRRSRSPLARGPSPSCSDYCVLVENLPSVVVNSDIMKFFNRARLDSDQILYLHEGGNPQTKSAFVLFKSLQEYRDALDCDNKMMIHRIISVRPVSREKMLALLEGQKLKRNSNMKNCIHVKFNILDVRKTEVMDFFACAYIELSEKNLILLRDGKGNGTGEALVSFQNEEEAMEASALNGKRFLGSEVRVRAITESEMQDMINPSLPTQFREDRYGSRMSRPSYGTEAEVLPNRPIRDERRGSRDFGRRSRSEDGDSAPINFRGLTQDGPTCIKLVNVPYNVKVEEVYDFCYGYKIIPGSVSLQYDKKGNPKGTATVVFESRQEALNAIEDLTGRPIGPRNIQLVFL